MQNKFFFVIIIAALSFVAAGCHNPNTAKLTARPQQAGEPTMTISSPAFGPGELIPKQYTCDGQNINPPLKLEGTPAEAKSLALVVDDPDAPGGTFVHWVVANINPGTTIINEHDPLPQATHGTNGYGNNGYAGPCPPSGTHHYHFKLFALDTMLDVNNPDAKTLEQAMQGHLIGHAELVSLYQKK